VSAPRRRDALVLLADFAATTSRLVNGPNRGGAPAGTGLTLTRLIVRINDLREPDGTPPTQEAVADDLGLSVRWLRRVASPAGGWASVIALAAEEPRRIGSGSRPRGSAIEQQASGDDR
jgi:hypothetical protein